MPTRPVESRRNQQPSHPMLAAALLMIGVALIIAAIAAAGVMT